MCNHRTPEGGTYCTLCGERMAHNRCAHCGAVCGSDVVFCAYCGAEVAGDVDSTVHVAEGLTTYSLDALMDEVHELQQMMPEKTKATQDDIRIMRAKLNKGQ